MPARSPRTAVKHLAACGLIALAGLLPVSGRADAQQHVRFPSFAADAGAQRVTIDGYLFRPDGDEPHPAVIFLHGCGGLLTRDGKPESRQTAWAKRLNDDGFVVLMVDSFSVRGIRSMCAPKNFVQDVYAARPLDAIGALAYLQSLPFVAADRIGLMGWSEGGGALLFTIRGANAGFRAAVAFYPASCDVRRMGAPWNGTVPLLVMLGGNDVWTPAAPCVALMKTATPAATVETQTYPGAYHDFDWPDMPVHRMPADRTSAGVVPIAGTNPAARADALERVPAFLERYLR